MDINIQNIEEENYIAVHEFQCKYLDEEPFEAFIARVKANPDLYLVAFDERKLVGICYGHPSKKVGDAINLQGIAVDLDAEKDCARKGIGSKLLKEFGNAVTRKGFHKIEVGAADDPKVERFYLKNGFTPFELVAKGPNHEEFERVSVDNYESGKIRQEELREKYRSNDTIFIMEKYL